SSFLILQIFFQELLHLLKFPDSTRLSAPLLQTFNLCKNRYFSNADAKVATFSEPANICASFFEKSSILPDKADTTYIY
ncbi:hypothetical protein, partial [Alistipes putredinis]|uniref:hypothetical protein n=1 Tax=Alistipes putredinis TaxID=28117 RepID=UPI003AF0AB8C